MGHPLVGTESSGPKREPFKPEALCKGGSLPPKELAASLPQGLHSEPLYPHYRFLVTNYPLPLLLLAAATTTTTTTTTTTAAVKTLSGLLEAMDMLHRLRRQKRDLDPARYPNTQIFHYKIVESQTPILDCLHYSPAFSEIRILCCIFLDFKDQSGRLVFLSSVGISMVPGRWRRFRVQEQVLSHCVLRPGPATTGTCVGTNGATTSIPARIAIVKMMLHLHPDESWRQQSDASITRDRRRIPAAGQNSVRPFGILTRKASVRQRKPNNPNNEILQGITQLQNAEGGMPAHTPEEKLFNDQNPAQTLLKSWSWKNPTNKPLFLSSLADPPCSRRRAAAVAGAVHADLANPSKSWALCAKAARFATGSRAFRRGCRGLRPRARVLPVFLYCWAVAFEGLRFGD